MNQKSDTTSSTSTKIPNVKLALEEKYKEESSKLPHPTGWRILVLPFQKKDRIIFARYSGSRFKIEGGEVRLLNDDEVLATIKNPEDILHEF